jgi:hypothetical protein
VLFYRPKGMIYKAWFTRTYIVRFEKLPLQGSPIVCSGRLRSM